MVVECDSAPVVVKSVPLANVNAAVVEYRHVAFSFVVAVSVVCSLPSGTTQTTLTATTNENATCRYSTTAAFTFASGTLFTTTGALSHSTTITGLVNGTS